MTRKILATLAQYHSFGGHRRIIEDDYPGEISKARNAALFFGLTGYWDIVDWRYGEWGTKRNAYCLNFEDDQPKRLHFRFDTANGFPRPIFEKLAAQFPALKFECAYFDEGWCEAGRGFFNGGDGEKPFCDEPPTAELYELVYGEKYEEADE